MLSIATSLLVAFMAGPSHLQIQPETKRHLALAPLGPMAVTVPLKRPGDRLYAEYRAIDPDGNNFDISVNGYDSLRPDRDGSKTVKAATP